MTDDPAARLDALKKQRREISLDLAEWNAVTARMKGPVLAARAKIATTYREWPATYDREQRDERKALYAELDAANAELAPVREQARWRQAKLTEIEHAIKLTEQEIKMRRTKDARQGVLV